MWNVTTKEETTMKERLSKLIDVKTIVTFVFVCVYNYLAIKGQIDLKGFETIVVMIVSFYFGTQVAKKMELK
jgi:hypothetical protein